MRATFAFLAVCVAHTGFAFEPYSVDVTQERLPEQAGSIDHLEPAQQTVPQKYFLAQFIEVASFTKGDYLAAVKKADGRCVLQIASIPADRRPTKTPEAYKEIEIPESLAEVIYQIWVNALLEVRYDRRMYRGSDGADYIFSTYIRGFGWMHGEAWSPEGDLPPRWLVDTGLQLVAFARARDRDAKAMETQLRATRDKLLKYLEVHGKH